MSSMNRRALIILAGLLVITIFLIAPAAAAPVPSEDGNFRALTGQAARNFILPADVRLESSEQLSAFAGQADVQVERYRQYFGSAAVLGGQLTRFSNNGETTAVIGAHYVNIVPQNRLLLTAAQAEQIALGETALRGEVTSTLMVDPQANRYFYLVENRGFDSRWFHWIDAENGTILNGYDGFATGSGIGVLGDTKDMTGLTIFRNGAYRMQTPDGRQRTYDVGNSFFLPGTLASDANDVWDLPGRTSPGQPALVDAHFYARVTDDYFLNEHGFDWLNHYSQGMVSSAHYWINYNNAGWNGSQMIYGDGDGTTFIEFPGDLDVVGHELAHGVTEATSNLIYQNESGALNEAFSDIMGTAIEYDYGTGNWTIGEDITVGTNGIRNMADPNEDGDPSHYADRYTGTNDNGGVHTNSGIANHWFYLLVSGGQNANPARASGTDVVGIGLADAEDIAFLGFTALTDNATFCDARTSTVAVGGAFAANVADAWDEVGVDTALCGGGGNVSPTADFTFVANGLSVDFTDTSSDPDGTIVSWDWDFGDGNSSSSQHPSHTYAVDGTYGVTLTVFDNDGASDSITQPVSVSGGGGGISLSGVGYKVRGFHYVDLTWSGASGASVDVFRDGNLVTTTANDGFHTDNTGNKGGRVSYSYQVCEAGTSVCSDVIVVNF